MHWTHNDLFIWYSMKICVFIYVNAHMHISPVCLRCRLRRRFTACLIPTMTLCAAAKSASKAKARCWPTSWKGRCRAWAQSPPPRWCVPPAWRVASTPVARPACRPTWAASPPPPAWLLSPTWAALCRWAPPTAATARPYACPRPAYPRWARRTRRTSKWRRSRSGLWQVWQTLQCRTGVYRAAFKLIHWGKPWWEAWRRQGCPGVFCESPATGTTRSLPIQDMRIWRLDSDTDNHTLGMFHCLTLSGDRCQAKKKETQNPLSTSLYQVIRFVLWLGSLRSRYNVHLVLYVVRIPYTRDMCIDIQIKTDLAIAFALSFWLCQGYIALFTV